MRKRIALSLIHQMVALFFFVTAGLLCMAVRSAGIRSIIGDSWWVMWVLSSVFGAAGFWAWKFGKQLRTVSATDLLASDTRQPILYLRSFRSDSKADTAEQQRFLWRLLPMPFPQTLATEEEQIEQVMSHFGPFVAIGRPGERLPQLGAHRVYSSNDAWQEHIKDLLQRSQLVLVRVDDTEGLWWEIETALTSVDPQRLIFLLPTSSEDYNRFLARVKKYIPRPLPATYTPKVMASRSFAGVLWFDPDWTPHVATCDTDWSIVGYTIASDLRDKLAPVLDPLEHYVLIKASPWRRLAATLLDLLIVIAALLVTCLAAISLLKIDELFTIIVILPVVVIIYGFLEATPLQATVGKLLLGLITLDRMGTPVGLMQSGLRFSIKAIEFVLFVQGLASLVRVTVLIVRKVAPSAFSNLNLPSVFMEDLLLIIIGMSPMVLLFSAWCTIHDYLSRTAVYSSMRQAPNAPVDRT